MRRWFVFSMSALLVALASWYAEKPSPLPDSVRSEVVAKAAEAGCAAPYAAGATTLEGVSIPGMPADILAADVDEDGNLDLVVATGNDQGPGQVEVLFGPFDGGTPQATWTSQGQRNFYRRLAVADLDGDGDLDIAAAVVAQAPATDRRHPFASYPCDGGPVADAGGPGEVDASLVSTSAGASVVVFRSIGTNPRDLGATPIQTFGFNATLLGDPLVAGSVDFGDFNGDGRLDLAVGGGSIGLDSVVPVQVLQNDGVGSLLPVTADAGWRSTAMLFGYSVRFLDWNADGLADLLVTNGRGTQWGYIFLGERTRSGTTLSPNPQVLTYGNLHCGDSVANDAVVLDGGAAVVAAAIDAMLTLRYGTPGAAVVVQTSGGSQATVAAPPYTTGVRLADLDDDGRLDLALATLDQARSNGQCGVDAVEAGALYCAGDVLGANVVERLAPGATFFAEGITAGDLHESTRARTFAVPACRDGGARFVVPIPDPAFAGISRTEQVTIREMPDAAPRPLSPDRYAVVPNDRLLYVAGGMACGASVTIGYDYSPSSDIAVGTTNASCANTTVSILFHNKQSIEVVRREGDAQ